MSLPKIYRKKGDTGPSINFTVLEDGAPANLLGANAYFQLRAPSATTLKVNKLCAVVDDTRGKFKYVPDALDFDTVGVLLYEVKLFLSNGQEYTAPSSGNGQLIVSDDLE